MKQYIMGMLTGASLILCAVMFIGANNNDRIFELVETKVMGIVERGLLNIRTGDFYVVVEGKTGIKVWGNKYSIDFNNTYYR